MRRIFFFLLLASCSLNLFSQQEMIRNSYFLAGASNEGISKFYEQSASLNEKLPVEKAYKGVAIAMYAELANAVADKFDYFNKGKALLESAVAADWYNPEIRFLRFSVQAEVPFIVGYSGDLKEDAYVVIDALEKGYIDPSSSFWKRAILFMNQSGELNADQQKRIRPFLS